MSMIRRICASNAFPGVFDPVEDEGRFFIDGGTLNIVAHTLSLDVAPDQIPDAIEVDLTGRISMPLIGAIAYIVVELIPEWWGGPGAAQARKRVANRLDPEKRYRELSDRLATSDTIANRAALAAECQAIGRFEEAESHYDHVLGLPQGDDPAYALAKAQAQFGRKQPAEALATLDALRERWPDFESAEGHLLYARSLAELGRLDRRIEAGGQG